jgi:hypothetical protein
MTWFVIYILAIFTQPNPTPDFSINGYINGDKVMIITNYDKKVFKEENIYEMVFNHMEDRMQIIKNQPVQQDTIKGTKEWH